MEPRVNSTNSRRIETGATVRLSCLSGKKSFKPGQRPRYGCLLITTSS